jgi:hypothetical protein
VRANGPRCSAYPELVVAVRTYFTPGIPGIYLRLEEPSVLDPTGYDLEDFDALPNLEMVLNVDPAQLVTRIADHLRGRG